MSVYRVLCGISYVAVPVVLLLGAAAVGALNAAWKMRRSGVGWADGPGALALLKPDLFTPDGQPLRRHALRMNVASLIVLAFAVVLAVSLSKHGGADACWVSSSKRQANER